MELSEIGKNHAIELLMEKSSIKETRSGSGNILVHKTFLEGINFDLVYNPLKHLGYKAVTGTVGELYARLATPETMKVSIAVSSRFKFEDISQVWEGITAGAEEYKIKSLSLDLIPSINGLGIFLSACGNVDKDIMEKRKEASSTDLLCLSGNVGAAYMGLQVLEREKVAFMKLQNEKNAKQPDLSNYKYILEAYLSPDLRQDILDRLAKENIIPTAGIFLVDGLASGIKQICKNTGLGARIYVERIPISSRTFSMAEEIRIDAITAALNGGDDYKLLFTIPVDKHEEFCRNFADFDIIGHMTKSDKGCILVTPDGSEMEIRAQGW